MAEINISFVGTDNVSGVANQVRDSIGGIGNEADNASGKTTGFFGGMLQTAGGVLLSGAISGITGQIFGLFEGAVAAERGQAQLNSVLKSTEGAAGMSADEVNELATEIANLTGIEDDAVLASENMLLTFTNIKGDVFPEATKTIADMATAMNNGMTPSAEQMKGQAIQLGKALNDPIKGISALSKVGVSFTEGQKKQIEAMVKAGDTAGAQRLILAELNKEFGGSAEAAGNTFGGQLSILKNKLADAGEGIIGKLLPGLTRMVTAISNGVGPALEWLSGIFGTLFDGGFSFDGIAGGLMKIREKLFQFITDNLPMIVAKFEEWGKAAIDWIGKSAPMLFNALKGYLQNTINLIMEHLPGWIGALAQLGIKLISWIGEQLPGLANNLGQFFNEMVQWVVANLPAWGAKLAELGGKLVQWVLDALPGLMQNLGTATGNLINWLIQTAIDIAPKLLELAGKFVSWVVTDVLPKLPGVLLQIAQAIGGFIISLVSEVGPKIGEVAAKFYTWVTTDVLPKLPGVLEEIWTAISGWIGGILDDVGVEAAKIGTSIMDAIKGAVNSAAGTLSNVVKSIINPIIDGVNLLIGGINVAIDGANLLGAGFPNIPVIAKLAAGSYSTAQGMTLVGERGPELVYMPGGAAVSPAGETRRILAASASGGGGKSTTINVNMNAPVYGMADLDKQIRRSVQQAMDSAAAKAGKRGRI